MQKRDLFGKLKLDKKENLLTSQFSLFIKFQRKKFY